MPKYQETALVDYEAFDRDGNSLGLGTIFKIEESANPTEEPTEKQEQL
jgi:hypothetical protein